MLQMLKRLLRAIRPPPRSAPASSRALVAGTLASAPTPLAGPASMAAAGVEPPGPLPAPAPDAAPRADRPRVRDRRAELLDLLDGKEHLRRMLTGREERILHDVGTRVEAGQLVLPHLPATSLAAMDMAARPSANIADVVQLIASDPVLSSELLEVANSALYAGREPCETLREAVMRIGTRSLRALILSISMRTVMMRNKGLAEIAEAIWNQSHSVAVIARRLAPELGMDGEVAFVLGLLHDIGKVALLDTVSAAAPGDIVQPALVGRAFYFHHERAGAEIASAWKLPEEIVEVAGCHHAFASNAGHGPSAALVSLAHAIDLHLSLQGGLYEDDLQHAPQLDFLGVAPERRAALLAAAEETFAAARAQPV